MKTGLVVKDAIMRGAALVTMADSAKASLRGAALVTMADSAKASLRKRAGGRQEEVDWSRTGNLHSYAGTHDDR